MKPYEIWYKGIEEYFRKRKNLLKGLRLGNQWIPNLVYISYPLLLIYLFVQQDDRFRKVLLIPLAAFVFTTVIRKIKNEPRPYEKYKIRPLIRRTKKRRVLPQQTYTLHYDHSLRLFLHKPDNRYTIFSIGNPACRH